MPHRPLKITLDQAEQEISRLNMVVENLHRCCRGASTSLGNSGMDPYPGRIGSFTCFSWLPKIHRKQLVFKDRAATIREIVQDWREQASSEEHCQRSGGNPKGAVAYRFCADDLEAMIGELE